MVRRAEMVNGEIARVLREIGMYLEMEGVAFKPRAYEKAAETIESFSEELADIYARGGRKLLEEISGVGKSIAATIEELVKTGRSKDYEALKRKTPVDLGALSKVEGLGPKKIKILYQKLHIRTLSELQAAAESGKIASLEGFGEKSEENIQKGIEFVKTSGIRRSLGVVLPEARAFAERLKKLNGVEAVAIAGSLRRGRDTIGDGDILAASSKPSFVMDYFVSMPDVQTVIAHGETKSSVKLRSGLQVDLRVVPPASYGAALVYFTGSKDHNVVVREMAVKKGMKLNEYGLYKRQAKRNKGNGWKAIAGKSEEEIYGALGMRYIEPELRENAGEIQAALQNKIPALIGYDDLKGDLQVQSDWTDGSASIEEMARAAMKAGLEYIAITDHTKRLAMAGGLDEKRLLKQLIEIEKVNKKLGGAIKVLSGTECDILKDGSLDLPDAALAKLDLVGVSVHSYFNLPKKEQTERIMRAMSNPNVDILFHPTGRIIGRRPPYEVDVPALIAHAKKTGTVLEVNASPERLDLQDEYIKKAVEAEVKLAINSDAHAPEHFEFLEYGVMQARRGWATRKDVINTLPLEKMLKFLKKK